MKKTMTKKYFFLGMSALTLIFEFLLAGCLNSDTWTALTEADKAKLAGVWEGKATVPVKDDAFSTSIDLTLAISNPSGSEAVKTVMEMDYTKFMADTAAALAKEPDAAEGASADDVWEGFSLMYSLSGAKIDGKKVSLSADQDIDDIFEDNPEENPQINKNGKKLKFTMPVSSVVLGMDNSDGKFDIVLTQVKSSKLVQ